MFGEQGDQRGLAQRLDDALYRLETWRPVGRSGALGVFCGLAAVALAIGWWYGRSASGPPVENLIPIAAEAVAEDTETGAEPAEQALASAAGREAGDAVPTPVPDGDGAAVDEPMAQTSQPLIVHVIGAVRRPGLVTVPDGARVDDVVSAAGGPTGDAAIDRLNLAAPVADGMQIRVPTLTDDADKPLLIPAAPIAGSGGDGGSTTEQAEVGPVNLNTATAAQLDTLPGIGPATAAAILRWREDNGGFHSPDDLLAVPGIGQAKMAAIRDLIEV